MTLARSLALSAVAASAIALGACASHGKAAPADHAGPMPAPAAGLVESTPSGSYPLTTCLVTDEPLGGRGVAYTYNGREVQFCCPGCSATFAKSPEKYLAKLDAASK